MIKTVNPTLDLKVDFGKTQSSRFKNETLTLGQRILYTCIFRNPIQRTFLVKVTISVFHSVTFSSHYVYVELCSRLQEDEDLELKLIFWQTKVQIELENPF